VPPALLLHMDRAVQLCPWLVNVAQVCWVLATATVTPCANRATPLTLHMDWLGSLCHGWLAWHKCTGCAGRHLADNALNVSPPPAAMCRCRLSCARVLGVGWGVMVCMV
jgi:hypothetical protein